MHLKRDAFLITIQMLVVKKIEHVCEHKQNVQSVQLDSLHNLFVFAYVFNFFINHKQLNGD